MNLSNKYFDDLRRFLGYKPQADFFLLYDRKDGLPNGDLRDEIITHIFLNKGSPYKCPTESTIFFTSNLLLVELTKSMVSSTLSDRIYFVIGRIEGPNPSIFNYGNAVLNSNFLQRVREIEIELKNDGRI